LKFEQVIVQSLTAQLQVHPSATWWITDPSTNNRVELFAMWLLSKVTTKKGVKRLQVFGDSKLMVDWANLKCRINNLLLEPLL
jgi:ribonuclease HI